MTYAAERRSEAFRYAREAIAIARGKPRRERSEWLAIVAFWRMTAAFYIK